jgi:hypothetical protein
MAPNIYWIITTSLIPNNYEVRKMQYTRALMQTIAQTHDIPNLKIIIVENNNNTTTFLDEFNDICMINYTDNNKIDCNYGTREIIDVQDCIKKYKIQDEDYVVKQTGRYFLKDNSPFVEELRNLETTQYECVMTYGSYQKKSAVRMQDCISGLLCMKAKYVKVVENNMEWDFAEYRWARASLRIPDDRAKNLSTLGIYIDPGKTNDYFLV